MLRSFLAVACFASVGAFKAVAPATKVALPTKPAADKALNLRGGGDRLRARTNSRGGADQCAPHDGVDCEKVCELEVGSD